MDLGIHQKRALVCASSQGLGKATAKALAEEGAELFLCSRSEASLKKAVAEVQAITKLPVHFATCDLTVPASRDTLIQAVNQVFSEVDILVHNVGGPAPVTVENATVQDWEKGFQELFLSVQHLNAAFLPGMKRQQWGRIVTITSLAALEPIPSLAVSNAIRAGVTAMLKTLSSEVAAHNICVNCVAPGFIETERLKELYQPGSPRQKDQDLKNIPAGRFGTPEEIAAVVAFLCSQQASYVTGSTVCVDGGKRRATV